MKILSVVLCVLSIYLFACKKYLDKKPDIKLAIPTRLEDFQALLDNNTIVENTTPGVLDLGSDDYYLSNSTYNSLVDPVVKNCYSWEADIYQGGYSADWTIPYNRIYIANIVLEGVKEFSVVSDAQQIQKKSIYGHALFVRAHMHYWLEETFGQPFMPNTASSNLGIPLKLSSSLNNTAIRSNVSEVFAQIIADLDEAAKNLPNITIATNRPSKATAFALMARVYLTMHDYIKAAAFADSSLKIYNKLFDYNLVSNPSTNTNPFSSFAAPNDISFEITYPSSQINYGILRVNTTNIDSNLYNSYNSNDLRQSVFFAKNNATNTWYFKGFYSASGLRPFSGIAVDEMYLTRAEANARIGLKDSAMADLNRLMMKRWKNTVSYPTITALDDLDAIKKILLERRKELIFRGIRWIDLRRLNQYPQFAVTLTRVINGQTYTLQPNSVKYVYPIPVNEIQISGIPQNLR